MFTAARPDDRSESRRSATALILSLALNASVGIVLFSMRAEAAPVAPPEAALTYVELTAPHAASGRAAAPAAKPAAKQPAKQTAVSSALPTMVTALQAPPQTAPTAALAVTPAFTPDGLAGTGDGTGTGGGSGPGDGPGDGEGSGSGDGSNHGIREVDFSEMRVRYQYAPRYPESALMQHLGEAICTVRLDVDTHGRPSAAKVSGCPEAFALTAEDAAMRWRFAPLMDGRTAVPGRFVIRFRFHPE
jgi:outer membrane biosynthesis protein TonB